MFMMAIFVFIMRADINTLCLSCSQCVKMYQIEYHFKMLLTLLYRQFSGESKFVLMYGGHIFSVSILHMEFYFIIYARQIQLHLAHLSKTAWFIKKKLLVAIYVYIHMPQLLSSPPLNIFTSSNLLTLSTKFYRKEPMELLS